MTDTDLIILNYMVDGRELITWGHDILNRVRAGELPPREARGVYVGLGPEIPWARAIAKAPMYANSRLSLEGLAGELEALREEARQLL